MRSSVSLQLLGLITRHPSPSASISSGLSSASSSPEDFYDARDKALVVLEQYGKNWTKKPETANVLRAFLDHLPKGGQAVLVADILAFEHEEDQMDLLGQHLTDAILKTFKTSSSRASITPSPANEAEEEIDASMSEIMPSSRADQSTLKKATLSRDGYRCLYSGDYDKMSVKHGLVDPPKGAIVGKAQCCHILPFALRRFDDGSELETRNRATVWWCLHRYFPDIRDLIDSGTINSPRNIITLRSSSHEHFSDFSLTFCPTDQENCYTIKTFFEYPDRLPPTAGNLPYVRFTSNNSAVPLPHPELLRVHNRVAEILWVSGIGAKIEAELYWATEDPRNINFDGSTDIGEAISRKLLMNV